MILTIWHSGKEKTVEAIKRSVVAGGWGGKAVRIGEVQKAFRTVKILCTILYGAYMLL